MARKKRAKVPRERKKIPPWWKLVDRDMFKYTTYEMQIWHMEEELASLQLAGPKATPTYTLREGAKGMVGNKGCNET